LTIVLLLIESQRKHESQILHKKPRWCALGDCLLPTPGRFSIVLGVDGFTHLLQFHPAISARDTPTAETAVEAFVIITGGANISPTVAIELKRLTAMALRHLLLLEGVSCWNN
jgi:hypothetical protein